ncbi:MAG: MFS transporter [Dactylosporangium sp.]|nr:MFS transporter [Dactylosporangium sp.]NNJ60309.1 MFS transporter [Dactylosporangium sp.]
MAFSTVPTPLYLLYQQQIGFGQFMVTVVFAAFAVGVVISLFLAGHLSDAIGRRRVLLPAILVEAVAAALFLVTPTLPGLITARFLSGIGIGLVVATATAYLSELHLGARPAAERGRADLLATVANMGGIGLGPLVSGLLAQYVTGPLRTPYLVFLMLLLASAVAVALVPETVGATRTTPGGGPGHPAALRYRPRRAAVPVAARPRYFAATAAGFTAFAVLGLFTSLAPSFVADTLDHPSRALAGAVAFLVFGMAGTAQVLLSRTAARRQIITGLGLMAGGLVPVTVAVWVPSLPVFLAGGAVAGAGAGVLLKGAVSTAAGLAEPSARGAALAGVFLAGYAGLTVPVLALGVATQIIAVQLAMLGFAGVVLVAIAAVGQRLLRPVPVAVADAQMSI